MRGKLATTESVNNEHRVCIRKENEDQTDLGKDQRGLPKLWISDKAGRAQVSNRSRGGGNQIKSPLFGTMGIREQTARRSFSQLNLLLSRKKKDAAEGGII